MKIKLAVSSIMLVSAMTLAMPAQANIMAQRSCSPEDVTLPVKGQTVQTTCVWQANDDNDMQITFHGTSQATKGHVECNFIPAPGSDDKITDIVAKKEAKLSSVNNNGRQLSFNITAPSSGSNANVLFYVNNTKSYTPNDKMLCQVSHYDFLKAK